MFPGLRRDYRQYSDVASPGLLNVSCGSLVEVHYLLVILLFFVNRRPGSLIGLRLSARVDFCKYRG